jgi:hypothetical protein
MTYCETTDLLKGDIPLPAYMGAGAGYIDTASDEMDTVLGQLYVTPIELDPVLFRPSVLWLKTCCKFIASGRLILDLDISEENSNLHAYGLSLLNQGLEMLKAIQTGAASITGAQPLHPDQTDLTGPMIYNEDSESLVRAGYEFLLDPWATPAWPPPAFGSEVRPYS